MAVKTITIDMEAYDILVRSRQGNESFSKVIKNTLSTSAATAAALLRHIDSLTVSIETLDDIDKVIETRGKDLIAAEPLDNYGS